MNQQVNLYQPVFRRARRVFSGVAIVQSLVLAAAGLGALYAYGSWQVHALADEVTSLGEQRDSAHVRLARLDQSLPKKTKSKVLARDAQALDASLGARRKLLATLDAHAREPGGGFSAYLEGLARQRVTGLWLTAFEIAGAGREVNIAGRALEPELVPLLVQRLSAEPRFAGLTFSSLVMDRPPGADAPIAFLLRTRAKEAKK